MTLQAKLTLGTVLLATVIVAVISAVDLGNIMELRFESSLARADFVGDITVGEVKEAINSQPELGLREALSGDRLLEQLKTVAINSKEIFEVAVVDRNNQILADSFPERRGEPWQRHD